MEYKRWISECFTGHIFQYNYSERGLGLSSLKNEAKSIVKVVQMSCGTNKTKFYIIIYWKSMSNIRLSTFCWLNEQSNDVWFINESFFWVRTFQWITKPVWIIYSWISHLPHRLYDPVTVIFIVHESHWPLSCCFCILFKVWQLLSPFTFIILKWTARIVMIPVLCSAFLRTWSVFCSCCFCVQFLFALSLVSSYSYHD